jgi:hypothetical protein
MGPPNLGRVPMGRARVVFLAFCLAALGLAAPARATTVTVALTGEWFAVTDNASVTNGSIAVGGSFTVTLGYDDATLDIDPDPTIGSYLMTGATLTLETGDYTFTMLPTSTVIFGIDDNVNGQDLLGWFADYYTTSGPLVAGASTGYGYMNPFIPDSTQTAHISDDLTDLPWSVAAYDSPNLGMYFLIEVLGKGPNKKIELFGDFTEFQVLPEPSALALGAFALLALARALRIH